MQKWRQKVQVPVYEKQLIEGGHRTVQVRIDTESVEIEIDVEGIGRLLGLKACRSSRGVSRSMNGLVNVRKVK